MQSLMMITHSSKISKRILSIFFTIGLSLVLAFCPIIQTVALAEVSETFFEVTTTIVSMIVGGVATNAILAAAGVTATTLILTGTVQAFIMLLIAIGIGIGVSKIVDVFLTETFNVEFWQILKNSWDNKIKSFKCSAAVFTSLVSQVKAYFGLNSFDHKNYYTEFPFVNWNIPVTKSNINSKYPTVKYAKQHPNGSWHNVYFPGDKDNCFLSSCKTSCDYDCFPSMTKTSVSVENLFNATFWPDNQKVIKFEFPQTDDVLTIETYDLLPEFVPYPIVYDYGVYFVSRNEITTVTSVCINSNPKYNGCYLREPNSDHDTVFYYTSEDSINLYVMYSDGSIVKPTSISNLFYHWLVKGGSLLRMHSNLYDVSTTDDMSSAQVADAYVTGSIDGTVTKGVSASSVKPKSKDVTYNKSKDVTKTVVGKLTGVNVKSGDVVIEGTEVKGLDITDSLDISQVLSITNVAAQDVVITDTTTGSDVAIPADGFIDWVLGINLIISSSGGITDKFPFCIPSYLKSQLNILVSDPKEPIFKIPFNIQSADIGGDITIDLTRFGGLTKITDFFLLAILVVGLAFSTKKLFF